MPCLPKNYNGNVVFELPPIDSIILKGERLRDMDRQKDRYFWTRIFTTTVNINPQKMWEFGKVTCMGSIECQNKLCESLSNGEGRNVTAWDRIQKLSGLHTIGTLIQEGGVVCHFCQELPFCVESCDARLFYMYPQVQVHPDSLKHMSRLAIHIGLHRHPSRQVWSREAEKIAKMEIKRNHQVNPTATSSGIKNATTQLLMNSMCYAQDDITTVEESEISESLMVVSTPQKFATLFRSVRQDQKDRAELEFLVRMPKKSKFPFLQRYMLPGQGCKEDRAHIFKMTVKGDGSGVDLLRQMKGGGWLEGAWPHG